MSHNTKADDLELIKKFEETLKKTATKQPLLLYSHKNVNKVIINNNLNASTIIANVTSQLKAIQKADTATCNKGSRKNVNKYSKSSFLPVNMFTQDVQVPQPKCPVKFDTQFVLDTQLINLMENPEAFDNNGITQEFDTTFNPSEQEKSTISSETPGPSKEYKINSPKTNSNSINSNNINVETSTNYVLSKGNKDNKNNDKVSENRTQFSEHCTDFINNCIEIESNVNAIDNIIEDEDIPSSYVFQPTKKSNTPSPLVFDLNQFEDFEKIALPIIEEQADMNAAKQLINSQILGKELIFQINDEPQFSASNIQSSPILKINNNRAKSGKSDDEDDDNTQKFKDSVYLKDEILFRSDEESEYVHKESQDLPLTCALETSFYNHSEVLDKTMFVGFQTASNRSIQISRESFTKAKSFLDDFNKDNSSKMSLTELVDKCDNLSNGRKSSLLNFESLDSSRNEVNLKSTDPEINHKFERIDDIAIDTIDFETMLNTKEIKNIAKSTDHTKPSDTIKNKDPTEEPQNNIKSIDNIFKIPLPPVKRKFDGFMTASNKKIKLSDEAIAKSKDLFQDIDLKDNFDAIYDGGKANLTGVIVRTDQKADLLTVDSQHIDEDILNEFAQDMSQLNHGSEKETEQFVGFKTASKKEIYISEEAVAKTKKIFEDVDANDDLCKNFIKSQIPSIVGLKTASKKEIHISEKAIAKTKKVFEDICVNEDLYKNFIKSQMPGNVGFKTASNKNIKISKEALVKSNNILEDLYEPIKIKNLTEKQIKMSDSALSKCEYTVQEILSDTKKFDQNPPETSTFIGFRTANNKNIEISEEAYKKTKNMFKNISPNDADFETIEEYMENPDLILNEKKTVQTDGEVEDIHKLQSEMCAEDFNTEFDIPVIDAQELPVICGLKTASQKLLENSEKSDSKAIFVELDSNNDNALDDEKKIATLYKKFKPETNIITKPGRFDDTVIKVIDAVPLMCGFKTASNKSLKISEEAIAKSKKLFEDLDLNDNFNLKCENNAVGLNEKNSIFNESHESRHSNKVIGSFGLTTEKSLPQLTTPSNKEMIVSEEAENININNDENHTSTITTLNATVNIKVNSKENFVPTFSLFKTASQKPVTISEEAFVKSKNLLKENNNIVETSNIGNQKVKKIVTFEGFQTANMKPIHISDQALAKSIALLRDIDDADDNSDINLLNCQKSQENIGNSDFVTKMELKFKGFQTASKKPVKISEAALAKSKLLFADIDNTDNISDTKESKFGPFHTANNKAVYVSTEALVKSKKILEDIDFRDDPHKKEPLKCVGFQTASNRKVHISEEALKKSRQLLKDDLDDNIGNIVENSLITTKNKENLNHAIIKKTVFSFKTANDNNIVVNEDALDRSRKLFDDHFEVDKSISVDNKLATIPKELNVEKLIDTQIINNFDTSLNTEDFIKETTPKQSKRSGSPILSCPKPKKRKKFETPYRNESKSFCLVTKSDKIEIDPKYEVTLLFTENYKKEKRYSLLDLAEVEKNESKKAIDSYITQFTYDSLLDFKFSGSRNDLTDTYMTVEEVKKYFFGVVNKKLIPDGWLDNHLRLIIWKLISYEVIFPSTLSGVCTVKNVLDQLKYRYDKELYDAERPILRKILEKDDVPSKTMVLCVAGIYVDGANVCGVTNIASNVELLLTDGWYSVKTIIDKRLTKLVYDEKIKVGCKIITNGAELLNCDQGVAPWEDSSSVRLKIFGNSTRLARWHTRLGCHSNGAILTQLSSVQPEGGKVSKLRVYISRVYPALFVEKFEDGSTVTRSERLENIHQVKYEAERQSAIEKLYEEVEKELSDQESQDSESGVANKKMYSDESQYNAGSHISSSQIKTIEERANRRRERIIQNIQTKLEEKMEKYGLNAKRNVVSLLKVRVAGVVEKNGTVKVTKGLMSIWKPNDAIAEIIKEGIWIEVLNVVPTAVRYSEIQISAGRNSVFLQSKYKHSDKVLPLTKMLNRKCYHIKELTENPLAHTDYNEIDTVGFVFCIEPSNSNFEMSKQPFQNVYLADGGKNIICVNFWGGLKKFGYQNILDTGQVFACVNLQKRTGNTKKSILHYRFTEFSYFTKTPKDVTARNVVEELVKRLSGLDKRKYCDDCLALKNNYSRVYNVNSVISPYRFNNDHNLSKNKLFIDSPVLQKPVDDLNLTGLDFESTFKQDSQLSPKLLLRKKKVNEKIAKLKMYGEPPPLSPIHIINRSKSALNEYKSPLVSNMERSVAIVKNTSENSRNEKSKNIQSSPIISMNRTYVKSMKPVKLNFNEQDNSTDKVIDHFAEEFDGSPPLSLD